MNNDLIIQIIRYAMLGIDILTFIILICYLLVGFSKGGRKSIINFASFLYLL